MFASYLRDHRAVRTMIYIVFAQRFSVIVDVHMGYPGSRRQLARRDLGASMVLIRRYVMVITYVFGQRRFTAATERIQKQF